MVGVDQNLSTAGPNTSLQLILKGVIGYLRLNMPQIQTREEINGLLSLELKICKISFDVVWKKARVYDVALSTCIFMRQVAQMLLW